MRLSWKSIVGRIESIGIRKDFFRATSSNDKNYSISTKNHCIINVSDHTIENNHKLARHSHLSLPILSIRKRSPDHFVDLITASARNSHMYSSSGATSKSNLIKSSL